MSERTRAVERRGRGRARLEGGSLVQNVQHRKGHAEPRRANRCVDLHANLHANLQANRRVDRGPHASSSLRAANGHEFVARWLHASMPVPSLRADHSVRTARFRSSGSSSSALRSPGRSSPGHVAAAALLLGLPLLGFGAFGCKEDAQADTPAPALVPSAPLATQGQSDPRCLPATATGAFLTVSDDFPLCVIGLHTAAFGSLAQDDQHFSAYGQPSWANADGQDGPITGGGCAPPTAGLPSGCVTAVDRWRIGSTPRAEASRSPVELSAGLFPEVTTFSSAAVIAVGPVSFVLAGHTSAQADRAGEVYLVRKDGFVRSSVNGLAGTALPNKSTPDSVFFYTGLSALYGVEASPPKAAGLYRVACDFDASTCSSAAVASWTDTPGLVSSDVDGNLVAVHSGLASGRQVVGFSAGSVGEATDGTTIKQDGDVATSLTVIGATGQPKHLVLVSQNGTGSQQDIALEPISFDGATTTLEAPLAGRIRPASGVRVQVFHDARGELWLTADTNGSADGGSTAFVHLGPRAAP